MTVHKKKKPQLKNFFVPAAVVLVIAGGIGFISKVMLTDTGPPRKNKITTVSLVKPPEQKEKLPEPEPPKELPKPQQIDTPTMDQPQDAPQQANDAPDDGPPAGSDLGVDAEGGAGSDGFGLVGKKGGRAITLGGGGG
ncbi:MAG: TonB C-terminal domain-containing protein, partial [Desulfuromonadales bacterium]